LNFNLKNLNKIPNSVLFAAAGLKEWTK